MASDNLGSRLAVIVLVGGGLVLFWPKIAQAASSLGSVDFNSLTPEQQARILSQRATAPGNAPATQSAPFNGGVLGTVGAIGGSVTALVAALSHAFGWGSAAAAGAGATAAAGGAAVASGGGGSSAAAGAAGGIGTAGTIAITGGIAGAALLTWGIWHEGLFRGGEEALQVSPKRDAFLANFAQFDHWRYVGNPPGFTGLANLLECALGTARKDQLMTQLGKADTVTKYNAAVTAIGDALQPVLTDAVVAQAKARHDAWIASGSPSS